MDLRIVLLVMNLVLPIYSTVLSFIQFKKKKLKLFFAVSLSYLANSLYSFFFLLIFLTENVFFTYLAYISFSIMIFYMLYATRIIIGKVKNYDLSQTVLAIFITIFVVSMYFNPESVVENLYFLSNNYLIIFFLIMGNFCTITINYYFYIRKHFGKNEDNKRYKSLILKQVLMILIFTLILSTVLYLKQEDLWSLLLVSVFFQIYLAINVDWYIFLIPLDPYYFDVVSSIGVPLYSRNLGKIENSELLSGALSALDSIFTESIDSSATLEFFKLSGYYCYVVMQEKYFVVFIDKYYSGIIQSSLNNFVEKINPFLINYLNNWDEIARKEDLTQIEDIFEDVFSFIPQLIRKNKKNLIFNRKSK